MIKAITFDCWDTLIVDDHACEPQQQEHLKTILIKNGIHLTKDDLKGAFQKENELRKAYVCEQRKTKNALQRLKTILEILGVFLPFSEMLSVADYNDKVALEFRPPAVSKVREVLASLAQNYQLAVICNTGWHSAETIEDLLAGHDLLKYFECLSFSDEIGFAKPHPRIFEVTLERLGCSAEEAVHIGDAEYSDIVGAKEANMRAILFTGVNAKYQKKNSADLMFDNYDDLASLLNNI